MDGGWQLKGKLLDWQRNICRVDRHLGREHLVSCDEYRLGVQVDGGWELNGKKRWIGNATFAEWIVIWARRADTGDVNAFLVQKGTPGLQTRKIENKIALRCVQNADIKLEGCIVPDSARLPGVNSFKVRCSSTWRPSPLKHHANQSGHDEHTP